MGAEIVTELINIVELEGSYVEWPTPFEFTY